MSPEVRGCSQKHKSAAAEKGCQNSGSNRYLNGDIFGESDFHDFVLSASLLASLLDYPAMYVVDVEVGLADLPSNSYMGGKSNAILPHRHNLCMKKRNKKAIISIKRLVYVILLYK